MSRPKRSCSLPPNGPCCGWKIRFGQCTVNSRLLGSLKAASIVAMSHIDTATLRLLLKYDPDTGIFRWNVSRGGRLAGSVAGHLATLHPGVQYVMIRINNQLIFAHRLAWQYMTGKTSEIFIDHKDGNSLNNRYDNLREATLSQNAANSKKRSDNTSGLKGVSYDKINRKWVARVRVHNGPYKNLGRYDDKDQAAAAYAFAIKELHQQFARTE